MQKVATGRPFILLLLTTGSTPPPEDEHESGRLQMAHLAHLFQMEQEGKCCVFGPVTNEGKLRGIIIFNTVEKETVRQWMSTDPWIMAGSLDYELYDWFTIPGQKIPE